MKRNIIALIFCSAALAGCSATSALTGGNPSSHRYQDGVYSARQLRQENTQALANSRTNASELITKTKQSGIYVADTIIGVYKAKPVVFLDYAINPFDVRFSFSFNSWWPYWGTYRHWWHWDPWYRDPWNFNRWYRDPWYWDSWYWDSWHFGYGYWDRWYWNSWHYGHGYWGVRWDLGPWGPWGRYAPYGPGPRHWYPGGWVEPVRPVVKSLGAGRHSAEGSSTRRGDNSRRSSATGIGSYGSGGSTVITPGASGTPRQRTPETPADARTIHNRAYGGSEDASSVNTQSGYSTGRKSNTSAGRSTSGRDNVRPSSTSTGARPSSSGSYRSGAGTVTYGSSDSGNSTRSYGSERDGISSGTSASTRATNQDLNKSVRSGRRSSSSGRGSTSGSYYRNSDSASGSGSYSGGSSSYRSGSSSSYSGGAGRSNGAGGGSRGGGGHSGNTGRR